MSLLAWTPAALGSLARLLGALPDAARPGTVRDIRQGLRLLETYPAAGRPAEGMDPDVRRWTLATGSGLYVALCRPEGEHLVVLAIVTE